MKALYLLLPCDAETAAIYSRVRTELQCAGNLLPENDLWIAATALPHDLILAIRDQHFSRIAALTLEQW